MDVNIRTMFSGSWLFGNAANECCSVLNGESADVPEDIVHSGLVAAFPAVCNGYRYTPKAIFSVDDTECIAVCGYVCPGVHMLYNSQVDYYDKPLADGHPSYIRPHQCDSEGSRKRGVLLY